MEKRVVRFKALLALILSLALMFEGGFPVAAFAADEPSAQETIGEAATKDDGAGEEVDAFDEAAADGSDEEPVETAAAEGYDADAVGL